MSSCVVVVRRREARKPRFSSRFYSRKRARAFSIPPACLFRPLFVRSVAAMPLFEGNISVYQDYEMPRLKYS